jgi:hypothetical protein
MLENTVKWRRDYRPDELDPDYIKPEVKADELLDGVVWQIRMGGV